MNTANAILWLGALSLSASLGCSRKEESPRAEAPVRAASPRETLIKKGVTAPSFEATTHTGEVISLKGLRGQLVVLYFYPKDGTPGCTAEAEGFRDSHDALSAQGAVIIGVSTQDNETHQDFARELGLPFLLLPDEEGEIAASYGVGSFLGFTKRKTVIIDREGVVARVYDDVSPENHAAEVLTVLKELSSKPQTD